MTLARRKFSNEQKVQILQQAAELGVTRVLKQHKLSYSVFARWKQQQVEQKNIEYENAMHAKKEKEQLEIENTRLKKIIANQALELELMSEILKKNS